MVYYESLLEAEGDIITFHWYQRGSLRRKPMKTIRIQYEYCINFLGILGFRSLILQGKFQIQNMDVCTKLSVIPLIIWGTKQRHWEKVFGWQAGIDKSIIKEIEPEDLFKEST